MKKACLYVFLLIILLLIGSNALAANTKADDYAKKGLIVDEAGLFRYSTRYREFGPKVEPAYASIGEITDSTYDCIYSRLRLKNRKEYSIGVRVSCEVYYNGKYQNTYSWEYTEIAARTGAHEFWLEEFSREDMYRSSFPSGRYKYSWYIDGNWLIDREIYMEQ